MFFVGVGSDLHTVGIRSEKPGERLTDNPQFKAAIPKDGIGTAQLRKTCEIRCLIPNLESSRSVLALQKRFDERIGILQSQMGL